MYEINWFPIHSLPDFAASRRSKIPAFIDVDGSVVLINGEKWTRLYPNREKIVYSPYCGHKDTGGPDQGGEFVKGMSGHPDNEMGM